MARSPKASGSQDLIGRFQHPDIRPVRRQVRYRIASPPRPCKARGASNGRKARARARRQAAQACGPRLRATQRSELDGFPPPQFGRQAVFSFVGAACRLPCALHEVRFMTCFAITAAATLALALSATGAPSQAATAQISAGQPGEFSAARKKVSRKYYRKYYYVTDSRSPYYLKPGVAPSFGYIGPPGYAGEYAWRKSIGQCVEDLGYGRWAPCGSR